MIQVNGTTITVSTKTLDATFASGALVSLQRKDGREYLTEAAKDSPVLEIVYRGGDRRTIKTCPQGKIACTALSDTCAEIRFDALDGVGVLTISEDEENGDLCIEPEVSSARYGVLAARWTVSGFRHEMKLTAPFFQGIDMDPEDSLINNRRWIWPHRWEAGLCILHDEEGGFWVHCRDTAYRAKSLVTGEHQSISFDAEAWGPLDRSLSAGGLVWRVNVFEGGWQVPAAEYRDWLWRAYSLEKDERRRPTWQHDIRLALSWAPADADLLKALAARVDPKTVLLHVPHWRIHGYDQCYPDFTPSESFKEYLRFARGLGFHVMPHANSVDMDPSMPEYKYVGDFKYREIENGTFLGWSWGIPMPHTNKSLDENRQYNVMVKIHPGLALWRAILAENIDRALAQLDYGTDAVFTDVTLCSYNLDNCLIDNTTSTEGMARLIDHVSRIHGGLAVGGEGLNEITMQKLSFAQVHLFDFNLNGEPLARTGKCDLNKFLFGKLCVPFGYSGLGGRDENEEIRSRVHLEHGAVPTIIVGSAADIENPTPEVARMLKLAAE